MIESISIATQDRADKRRRSAMAGGLVVVAVAIGVAVFPAGPDGSQQLRDPDKRKLTDILSQTIETRGIAAAVDLYRGLQEQRFSGLYESEPETNSLGYSLLGKGQHASAIQVFELNRSAHPESANVHDSLGEAYLVAGDKARAIESYERAVAIDPKMRSAVAELQRLTGIRKEPYRPIVFFHILAGTLGLLSGVVAMCLRKGSPRHAMVGRVFVVSMLCMSATGAYRAFVAPDGEPISVAMGALTFYLVATAWSTARRRTGATGSLDWVALLVAVAVTTGLLRLALTDRRFAMVPGFFAAVALLAAVSDFRMIVRNRVVTGTGRVARHLWRMCTALYIAVTSLFLGQSQIFPYEVRQTGLLVVPGVLVVIALFYWLIRVKFSTAFRRADASKPRGVAGQAIPTP